VKLASKPLPQCTANVRFGSEADICSAPTYVRFTPNSDRKSGHSKVSVAHFVVGHSIIAPAVNQQQHYPERAGIVLRLEQ
jgi:hypothetical protein